MPSLSTPATIVTLASLFKPLAFCNDLATWIIEVSQTNHCSESPNELFGCVWNFQGGGVAPTLLGKKSADEGSPTSARDSTPHWLKCRK